MPGQSSCKSKSNNRKFVTNNLTSGEGIGFSNGALLFVLTDRLREWPWLVLVVAVDDCEVDRDMLSPFGYTCATLEVIEQLLSARNMGTVSRGLCCLCAKADTSDKSA
jgi:hypothetical protein